MYRQNTGLKGEQGQMKHNGKQVKREAAGISVRGLAKNFGTEAMALKGVDLDIEGGEFFTLLGPSGSGKTTLLRLLAGFELPSSGTIHIGGREVTNVPPHKRNVNTVFQSYALFPHLNVRENVGFGLKMHRVGKSEIARRVDDIAKSVDITQLLDRRVNQLSGGQQQRVALSRALVNEPDVLLLDEPLSALDAGLRHQLQIELMRIQHRFGMTFVFVTHDQQEAMVMSDRIAILNDGHIQQKGTPQDLYESPANLFVAKFMGHKNIYPIREYRSDGLKTDLGWLEGSFTRGTHVLLRPEIIMISAASAGLDTSGGFPSVVKERVYRGSVAEYLLGCGGAELIARCTNYGQTMFAVGEEVMVSIRPDGVVTFNE